MKKYLNTIKIMVLGLMLSLGVGFVLAEWSGPTEAPFGGNTAAPLNVGADMQTKSGSLWSSTFLGSEGGLYVQSNAEVGGNLTVGGGNPDAGKIFMSQDDTGLGAWSDKPTLVCQRVGSIGGGATASASCGVNAILVGGGGSCSGGNGVLRYSRPQTSQQRWEVGCTLGNATATAICCDADFGVADPIPTP